MTVAVHADDTSNDRVIAEKTEIIETDRKSGRSNRNSWLKKPCIEAAPGRASGRRSNPAERHHSARLRK
ncbi:hypothetical protein [Bradyrhizobium sp. LA2.1]|uniref:hypothetical protein n=1 Tax=Bradyrhizobium sp. LA2.1 TaxID=3156376 RepID=UPI00339186CA